MLDHISEVNNIWGLRATVSDLSVLTRLRLSSVAESEETRISPTRPLLSLSFRPGTFYIHD